MRRFLFWQRKKTRDYTPFLIQEGKILNESVKEISKKRWVEDAWLAGGFNKKKELSEYVGIAASNKTIKLIGVIIFIFSGLLVLRSAYLQIWQGQELRVQAEDNRLRIKPLVAERGIIYDRNLQPLVDNIPSFNLVLNPKDLPQNLQELENVLKKISLLSGATVEELKNKIDNGKNFVFQSVNLVENLNYEKAMNLLLQGAETPAITLEQSYNRHYLYAPLAYNEFRVENLPKERPINSLSHLLGYTGKVTKEDLEKQPDYLLTDFIGKTGLEKNYEKELRGVYGQKSIEIDAFGKEKNIVKIIPPQTGKSLILSINLEYQRKLEEILANHLRAANKTKASAILLDPNNGEILALLNFPTYNNNAFAEGISSEDYEKLIKNVDAPLFPRAWSGQYPSGSTIKPLYAAAALNEGIINKNTSVLSTGGIQVDRWFFPDWKAGGHGPTDVRKAIAESVNTFFYFVGGGYNNFTGLGLDRLISYLKLFGLGSSLGLDLPGEAAGFIPSRQWKKSIKKEQWFIGDTYNLSIGQGDLLVTPLQIASLTAVVANGGTLYRPHLVKSFYDSSDNSTQDVEIVKLKPAIIPDDYLKIVREGMRQTVINGSAEMLADLSIKVAGKTGTAQWSSVAANHAWFTSFAPFDNPKVVLTFLIEEGGEGSATAVPVAKDFFRWLENRLN